MEKTKKSGTVMAFAFTLVLISIFSCSKGSDTVPGLTVSGVSQERGNSETVMRFHLVLNKPSENTVSVDYTLTDGTATSQTDFVQASGNVSIPPAQTEATIDVRIKADTLNERKPNLVFTVTLSNPKFCTLITGSATGTIITENGTYLSTENKGYSTPLTYAGYTLVWSDEFSGKSLNTAVWNQEQGTGSGGWGNNELEYYTNSLKNTFISNGNLIIEARKETIGSSNYTSGRMTTQNNKVFKFGRIDIRAKLPVGKGLWPALWMLGTNINTAGWPACGEIDNMELIGTTPATVYGTLHWANSAGAHASKGANYALLSGDFSKEFHVFSLVWAENNLQWFVDDQKYLDISISDLGAATYPFNSDQFFIFNVAVGGNWPGPPDFTTDFPERMYVDYIRVFQ